MNSKIYLRNIEKSDLKIMKNWYNDDEITHYMVFGIVPISSPIFCSWSNIEDDFEKLQKSKKDVVFSIIDKKSDELIGITGLYEINWIARNAELRIIIGKKDFLGKGYGGESVKLLVEYGFKNLNLHKISLGCNASDERANKCYKKSGFVYEGTLRDYLYRNGKYYNANLYSILEDEWIDL